VRVRQQEAEGRELVDHFDVAVVRVEVVEGARRAEPPPVSHFERFSSGVGLTDAGDCRWSTFQKAR